MVELPGGTFRMGSADFYPEERPVREVSVDAFRIDRHPVTVAEFRRFVKDTGYVTCAEKAPEARDYPGADRDLLVPGSLVFRKTTGPVDLDDYTNWWAPNEKALIGMCRAAGFTRVQVIEGAPSPARSEPAPRTFWNRLRRAGGSSLRELGLKSPRPTLPEVTRYRAIVHAWK